MTWARTNPLADHQADHDWQQILDVICRLEQDDRQRNRHPSHPAKHASRTEETIRAGVHRVRRPERAMRKVLHPLTCEPPKAAATDDTRDE